MTRDLPAELSAREAEVAPERPHDDAGEDRIEAADGRDFSLWLTTWRDEITDRWVSDVRARLDDPDPAVVGLLRDFYDVTLELLTGCFGPYRSQFEPLLREAAELYGSLGAMRSLAAGEIIEEVQIVREALIRRLFTDPPAVRSHAILLREILRLNRVVDGVVTFASVGHTDALFFALFRGSGAPKALTDELWAEVEEQLETIRSESERLIVLLGRS